MATGTHHLTLTPDRVTKRYTSWSRGEPHREWHTLTLLATHAPDLAPHPISTTLTHTERRDGLRTFLREPLPPESELPTLESEPPSITMTRLPGAPVGPRRLADLPVAAIARAITAQHASVPPEAIADLPDVIHAPPMALPVIRGLLAAQLPDVPLPDDPAPGGLPDHAVIEAWLAAREWTSGHDARGLVATWRPTVLGQGDVNADNLLVDGGAVRLVDFEDSGRSEPEWELAALMEHIELGGVPEETWQALVAAMGADPERVRQGRRLLASFWLGLLRPGGWVAARNPPDRLRQQAARVRRLLPGF